jgi:signal transduction histidine kinase/ActR/RegA family two-component response regulator
MPFASEPPSPELASSRARRRVLVSIAGGEPLVDTMVALIETLEAAVPGARLAVFEVIAGDRLRAIAAPSLPRSYVTALGEIPFAAPGPYGAAARRRVLAIVEDVARDAHGEPWTVPALASDLHACAALPILGPDRRVLGVLALHRHAPGPLLPATLELLDDGALLASFALQQDERVRARQAIDERDQVEQALRSSEDAFHALFEASPIASVILRPGQPQIFMANAQSRATLGLDDRGIEALDASTVLEEPAQFAAIGAELDARGEVLERDVRLRLRGELRDCLLSARRIPFHGGMVSFVTVSDVTERRRQDAALREGQRLESLGVLSGGIAHDFNNLLTPMFTNLALARERLEDGHPALELLAEVEGSARRAAELVRQMLTYAGKGRASVEPLEIGEVVRDLSELLAAATTIAPTGSSTSATFQRARLVVDVAPALPRVEADAAQLRQVILTLVTNAAEAMFPDASPHPARDPSAAVRLSARLSRLDATELGRLRPGHDLSPGEYVTLEVADAGQGMSAATLERVFEPFFTTKGAGRGLGMSAVMGILRSHRGAIELTSEEGRGTVVRVYLRPVAGARPSRRAAANSARPKLRGRVLLADDDPAVRASATRLLSHLGLVVVAVEDGAEAVALFEARPSDFDVVLLDVTMPQMGGLEALARIRARVASVPCVLCSGYSDREVAVPEGQGLAFLAKPYTLQEIYRCLSQALGEATT